jgi:hypothetical protein
MATELTREDVIHCYRTVLRRDPENEEVVQSHLVGAQSLWRLIEVCVNSDELKMRITNSAATREDVIQCYKTVLRRDPESEEVIQRHLGGRNRFGTLSKVALIAMK